MIIAGTYAMCWVFGEGSPSKTAFAYRRTLIFHTIVMSASPVADREPSTPEESVELALRSELMLK